MKPLFAISTSIVMSFSSIASAQSEAEDNSIDIEAVHSSVVEKFSTTSKPANSPAGHDFTNFLSGKEPYRVNLIGLVKSSDGTTVFESHDDNEKLEIQFGTESVETQIENNEIVITTSAEPESQIGFGTPVINKDGRQIVIEAKPPVPDAIPVSLDVELGTPTEHEAISTTSPEVRKPDSLDKGAIARFRDNRAAKPQGQHINQKIIAHGPVRANQQSCITCHQVEKGTLLGVFRYEFKAEAKTKSLAAN